MQFCFQWGFPLLRSQEISTVRSRCFVPSVESIALPRFLIGDVEKKRVVPAMDREGARYSDIRFMERVGGKVILQGAEGSIYSMGDGLGWTAALSEETGRFVLTASGEDAAFVVFGACIPY